MRFGMYVDMRNPPEWSRPYAAHYGRWLERIEEAERLGADAVWLTEHHFFDDGYLPQCFTYAAAIAARTSRIRIGTTVALLPLHKPMELAEQIAIVDIISDGRVEPGFGVGYRKPEYLAFDGDFKHRYGVFADGIREMRRLWGEEPGAERTVTPPPIQRPVPMWGGFGGPMGARTAGRLGLGLQSIAGSCTSRTSSGSKPAVTTRRSRRWPGRWSSSCRTTPSAPGPRSASTSCTAGTRTTGTCSRARGGPPTRRSKLRAAGEEGGLEHDHADRCRDSTDVK